MVQFDPVGAVDAVVVAPAVGGPPATADEAVQHGQERRALQREVMVARPRQALDHRPAAGLLPHPLEGERRTDAARGDRRRLAAVKRIKHDRLLGKAGSRAQEPLQLPALLEILDAPERRDHLLAYRRALAPALDDLQIGAAARSLLAEIHDGTPVTDSMSVRTDSAAIPEKSSKIGTKRGTTFSRQRTPGSNHINGLRATHTR